jgi:hypothetical protein
LKAIVLERNKMVGRRIARVWACAGLDTVCVEEPGQLQAHLQGAAFLGADGFDGEAVLAAVRANPSLAAGLWTSEPLERVLRFTVEEPRISHIFGRSAFDAAPREWELIMVARRLLRPEAPPFGAFLSWGYTGFKDQIRDSSARDGAVAHVQKYLGRGGIPKRIAEMFAGLAHELLMNALYDAPVDAEGRPRHAHDRKAQVALADHEAATLRLGCDGVRLAIQVSDPFGRLERGHVFAGLARGLKGHMEKGSGGAGLGLVVCLASTVGMVFDVIPGHKTEVTGVFDLDLNLREFKLQAKSVHWFEHGLENVTT